MIIKGLVDEDFVNYKKPSMVLLMPHCNWKCGQDICHNLPFAKAPEILIEEKNIVNRYIKNPITEAIVFSGLEPFMDFKSMLLMIAAFRKETDDVIIIYSGYNKDEIAEEIKLLQDRYTNIIVKFGRYVPGKISHVDRLLGIELVSPNQFAKNLLNLLTLEKKYDIIEIYVNRRGDFR